MTKKESTVSLIDKLETQVDILSENYAHALNQLNELRKVLEPFVEAFDEVRTCHEPREDHENYDDMQEFLDRNQCVPSGTTIGDWRKLVNTYKDIYPRPLMKTKEPQEQ